jgi:hypothetical protein
MMKSKKFWKVHKKKLKVHDLKKGGKPPFFVSEISG